MTLDPNKVDMDKLLAELDTAVDTATIDELPTILMQYNAAIDLSFAQWRNDLVERAKQLNLPFPKL